MWKSTSIMKIIMKENIESEMAINDETSNKWKPMA